MKNKLIISAVSMFLLLQGCSTTSQQAVANVVVAEPLSVDQETEINIARITEILNKVEISPDQRAQLYYDRGVRYDSAGLRGLASYDFHMALRIKPDLVEAYNFIGIHYTQRQDFLLAYEAFDSAIELDDKHQYAYLNRAIALYYGARPELAVLDVKRFQSEQNNDPYRIAWLYMIEHDIDNESALVNLRNNLNSLQHNSWANNILRLFLGDISEDEFIKYASQGAGDDNELAKRLCEIYFYLGKYNQIHNNPDMSQQYFKFALGTNVYEYIEHRYAKLELELMRTKVATP